MTIADTFNRADSASTINPASDGGTWTLDGIAVYGITSNQAYLVSAASQARRIRRNTNQVDADMTLDLTFDVSVGFSRLSMWFAYDPALDTGYVWSFDGHVYTWAAGAQVTDLGSIIARNSPHTHRLTYNHLTGVIQSYRDGTPIANVTDGSPITGAGNTWVGISASQPNSSTTETWDNFSAVSTAGAAARRPSVHAHRTQALMRAAVR